MSDLTNPARLTFKRYHADVGEVQIEILSTDSEVDVQRKCAVAIAQARRVYQFTPGFHPNPQAKGDKKAKDSRLDIDTVLGRIWFSCAWIPSPEDNKKPHVEAIRRVVGIIFAGCAELPQYERETYRNWVSLSADNVELLLRNVATAPLDIPATDADNLWKWYFGGDPATPPVKAKKESAPPPHQPTATEQPPASAPQPQPDPTPPAEAPTNGLTRDEVMLRAYDACWDSFRLVNEQVDVVAASLPVDFDKHQLWRACKAYATQPFGSLDEVTAWLETAFVYTIIPTGVTSWSRFAEEHASDRFPTMARTALAIQLEAAVDNLREQERA